MSRFRRRRRHWYVLNVISKTTCSSTDVPGSSPARCSSFITMDTTSPLPGWATTAHACQQSIRLQMGKTFLLQKGHDVRALLGGQLVGLAENLLQ